MNLGEKELFILAQTAIAAAKEAGVMVKAAQDTEFKVERKADATSEASSVVTEIDLKSQEIILKYLNGTLEICDLGLLAEEDADDNSRFVKDFFWCVDPLDGTLPFSEGRAGYSVAISLIAKDGTPYIGVVYDPVTETTYHAIKGQGSFINNNQWKLKPSSNDLNLKVFIDRSFKSHMLFDNYSESVEFIQYGAATMNALKLLEYKNACYVKLPKNIAGGGSIWDFAATACIYNELGIYSTDINGEALDLNRADSTFMNHRGVLFASNKQVQEDISGLLKNQ